MYINCFTLGNFESGLYREVSCWMYIIDPLGHSPGCYERNLVKLSASKQKDQDLADYLDMFLDNMKNRKIPQAAQARHLIPLLNVKATSAIAGLVAEARNDIEIVVKTLMDTAHMAPAYISQQLWQAEKEANKGVRATTLKMTRQARRLGKDAEQILDRLLAEKVLQMYHPDVQKYV